MNPQLTTAPGRIDIYVWGERFTSYETEAPVPGFTVLHANGLRSVTRDDGPGGRGMWLEHGNVNGVAFGESEQSDRPVGRIVTSDLSARRGSQSVGFRHACSWIGPDGACLLHDVRTVRAAQGPSLGAVLDIHFTLTAPADSPVLLGQSESGLLCTRVAASLLPAGGGQLRNSHDEFGPAGVHGRQAAWCACNGVVRGETVGLAILDHPGNTWHPSPWLCRDDGLLSPSPFPWRQVKLDAGSGLALRYRIIVHSEYVEAGWVQARLSDWMRE